MSFLAIGEEECPFQGSQRVENKQEACHGAFRKESRGTGRAEDGGHAGDRTGEDGLYVNNPLELCATVKGQQWQGSRSRVS